MSAKEQVLDPIHPGEILREEFMLPMGISINNPSCGCRIFTERLPALVATYARKTTRLITVLRAISLALGGQAGARLAARLRLLASPATFLRLVRAASVPQIPAPQAVGLDEWAWRWGHRYGTILVNLADHRVVDLLPDHSAATVAAWLAQHPTITVWSTTSARHWRPSWSTSGPRSRRQRPARRRCSRLLALSPSRRCIEPSARAPSPSGCSRRPSVSAATPRTSRPTLRSTRCTPRARRSPLSPAPSGAVAQRSMPTCGEIPHPARNGPSGGHQRGC
jgi:hypothetical protein